MLQLTNPKKPSPRTRPARAAAAGGMLFAVGLLLSGCLKVDVDLEVTRFDTFSGTIVIAVAEELEALSDGTTADAIGFGGVFDETPGVTVESYDAAGFVGDQATFEGAPFVALDRFGDDRSTLSLRRTSEHVIFEGTFDFGTEESPNDFASELLLASASDMEVSVSFPGKIVETNGLVDEASNTVTWEPRLGETTYFYAKSDAVPVLPLWAWVLIGPAIVGTGFFFWKSRRPTA